MQVACLTRQTLPAEGGLVDGKEVRGVLMRSGLDVQVLGAIWMDVDQDRRGKVPALLTPLTCCRSTSISSR